MGEVEQKRLPLLILAIIFAAKYTFAVSLTPIVVTANYSHPYVFSLNTSLEYVFLYSDSGVSILFITFFSIYKIIYKI